MTTDNASANALLAAASVKQRQRILDEALGRGWRAGGAADLMFIVCVIGVFAAAATNDFKLGIAAAGFALAFLYVAMNAHVHRRVQAILRLLEKG